MFSNSSPVFHILSSPSSFPLYFCPPLVLSHI
jgi:hypothetical protein